MSRVTAARNTGHDTGSVQAYLLDGNYILDTPESAAEDFVTTTGDSLDGKQGGASRPRAILNRASAVRISQTLSKTVEMTLYVVVGDPHQQMRWGIN